MSRNAVFNSQGVVSEDKAGGLFEFSIDRHIICKQSKPFWKQMEVANGCSVFPQRSWTSVLLKKMRTDIYTSQRKNFMFVQSSFLC